MNTSQLYKISQPNFILQVKYTSLLLLLLPVALRPFQFSLGFLSNRCPLFSVYCYFPPSFNTQFPQILLHIIYPSLSGPSSLSSSFQFTLKYYFGYSAIIHSNNMNLRALICAIKSGTLNLSLISLFVFILHCPSSLIGP